MRTRLLATLIRTQKAGSRLVGAITDSAPLSGYIQVEYHTDFQSDGGDFVIEPGSGNEEVGTYGGLDMWNDRLLDITRPDPKDHPDGAVIWAGLDPYEEKLADGHPDGDTTQIILGAQIRGDAMTYLRVGAYAPEEAPMLQLEAADDDDDERWVVSAPFGVKPIVGSDIDTINVEGIVESDENAAFVFDAIDQTVTPIGIGDGATPTTPAAAPVITQGPRIHVVDMRAYTKPTDWLDFEIEVSTNAGGAWTSLGNAGSDVFAHTNLTIGTAYRYRYKVLDSEGNVSSVSAATIDYTAVGVGTSDLVANSVTAAILAATITVSNTFQTAASGSRVVFDGSGIRLIDSGGTTVANLNASTGVATLTGAVYKTATSGSRVEIDSAGLRFYNSSGVLKLEAKTSDSSLTLVGDLTSGSNVTGATITGGTVQTDSSGARVRLNGSNDRLEILDSSGSVVANFYSTGSGAAGIGVLGALNLGDIIFCSGISMGVASGGDIHIGSSLQSNTDTWMYGRVNIDGYIIHDAGPEMLAGSVAPGGNISAPPGSIYQRTNGNVYIKTSGSGDTGWQTVTTS